MLDCMSSHFRKQGNINCDMVTLNLCAYFGTSSEPSVGVVRDESDMFVSGRKPGERYVVDGDSRDDSEAFGIRGRKRLSSTCGRLAPINMISARGGLVNPWLDCRNWKDHDILHNKCKR
jgi:hypothetical protein